MTPKTGSMKEITDNLEFIIITNFCPVKNTVRIMKIQATNWETIFAKDTSDKGLLSKIRKKKTTKP